MTNKYKIYKSSTSGNELIDWARTLSEAQFLVNMYRQAFGKQFTIYIK